MCVEDEKCIVGPVGSATASSAPTTKLFLFKEREDEIWFLKRKAGMSRLASDRGSLRHLARTFH